MLDGRWLAFFNRLRRDPLVTEHSFAVRSHNEVSQFRRHAPAAARGDHRAPQNGIRRLRAATDIAAGGTLARPTGVPRDFRAGAPRA